jgi:RNA polymerase sigma-70 factor (ECF subfamily)
LDGLPEPYRAVVVLVDIQEMRYSEVAECLAIPIGTVRSRLARGRGLLQQHLWQHAREAGLRPDGSGTSGLGAEEGEGL